MTDSEPTLQKMTLKCYVVQYTVIQLNEKKCGLIIPARASDSPQQFLLHLLPYLRSFLAVLVVHPNLRKHHSSM